MDYLTTTQKLVLAVSAGTIVFISWKIYRTYKEIKDSIIVTDEAEEAKKVKEKYKIHEDDEDEIYYTAPITSSDLEVEVDPDDFYPTQDIDEEGDVILMYDKDSEEAYSQFIDIKLFMLPKMSPVRQMYEILFLIPYEPAVEGDEIRYRDILESRWMFFGEESRYSSEITWGELFVYYAEQVDRQVGANSTEIMDDLLYYTGLTHQTPSRTVDDILGRLSLHTFYHNGKYGLFGLNDAECFVLDTRIQQTVAKDTTFDLEFDVYLNRKVGEM